MDGNIMNFTIHEGVDFYCEFIIKEPGASIPKDITGATGVFVLSTIGNNPTETLRQSMSVIDGINGIIAVSLSSAQTSGLMSRVAFPEDGYLPVATYKAELQIQSNEPIAVYIPKVFVVDGGS